MKKTLLVITAAFGMLYAGAHRNNGSMNGLPIPAGDPPAATVIADYIKATGGEEELKKIKTIQMDMEQGSLVKGTIHRKGKPDSVATLFVKVGKISFEQMAPNKLLTIFHTDSLSRNPVHSKSVFDGTHGFTMHNGTRSSLPAAQLARWKREEYPIMQLQYLSDPTIKIENKGSEKINGQDCYKIQVDFPDGGGGRIEYYAVQSKLLVRTVDASVAPTTTIDYDHYAKVGRVLLSCRRVVWRDGARPAEERVTNIRLNAGVSGSDF